MLREQILELDHLKRESAPGPPPAHLLQQHIYSLAQSAGRARDIHVVFCFQDGNNIDEAMATLLREVISRRGVGVAEPPKGTPWHGTGPPWQGAGPPCAA